VLAAAGFVDILSLPAAGYFSITQAIKPR